MMMKNLNLMLVVTMLQHSDNCHILHCILCSRTYQAWFIDGVCVYQLNNVSDSLFVKRLDWCYFQSQTKNHKAAKVIIFFSL